MVSSAFWTIPFLFILVTHVLGGSEIKLKAKFKKETVANNRIEERVEGILYLSSKNRVFLDVLKPLRQKVFLKDNVVVIYYPDENIGFEIETKFATEHTFFNPFLHLELDKVLSKMGCKLIKSNEEDKTGYYEYEVSKKINNIGKIVINKTQNVISRVAVLDKRKKIVSETFYQNYIQLDKIPFPKRITITTYGLNSFSTDVIEYDDVEVNPVVPESYINFTFPKGTHVKRIKL